jgi:hypothetical protein
LSFCLLQSLSPGFYFWIHECATLAASGFVKKVNPVPSKLYLLFGGWDPWQLFEIPREDSEGFLRYSTAFVEGASNIFWIDLQSNVRRFFSLFDYTLEQVLMDPDRLTRVPKQVLLPAVAYFLCHYGDSPCFLARFATFELQAT